MLNAHSCIYVRSSDAKVYYFNVNWVLGFKFIQEKQTQNAFFIHFEYRGQESIF